VRLRWQEPWQIGLLLKNNLGASNNEESGKMVHSSEIGSKKNKERDGQSCWWWTDVKRVKTTCALCEFSKY
jgi:hypothetical protein